MTNFSLDHLWTTINKKESPIEFFRLTLLDCFRNLINFSKCIFIIFNPFLKSVNIILFFVIVSSLFCCLFPWLIMILSIVWLIFDIIADSGMLSFTCFCIKWFERIFFFFFFISYLFAGFSCTKYIVTIDFVRTIWGDKVFSAISTLFYYNFIFF